MCVCLWEIFYLIQCLSKGPNASKRPGLMSKLSKHEMSTLDAAWHDKVLWGIDGLELGMGETSVIW